MACSVELIREDYKGPLFEPPTLLNIVRHNSFDFFPEPGGMIEVDHVAQLMDHDIIQNVRRQKDELPVETQVMPSITASPPGFLIPNAYFFGINAHERLKTPDAFLNFLQRLHAKLFEFSCAHLRIWGIRAGCRSEPRSGYPQTLRAGVSRRQGWREVSIFPAPFVSYLLRRDRERDSPR